MSSTPQTLLATVPAPPPCPDIGPDGIVLLRLLASATSTPAIAEHLGTTQGSVTGRLTSLREAMGAGSNIHAVSLGVLHHLVTRADVPLPSARPPVTEGQRPYLNAVFSGASAQEIALDLGRTRRTVETTLSRLHDLFAAGNRTQLAAAALLTDHVTCATADDRFPPVPLSALPTPRTDGGPSGAPSCTTDVACAVVVRDLHVLLVRPLTAVPLWRLPGGQVSPGEKPEHAAAREAHRETGARVVFGPRLGHQIHPRTHTRTTFVACRYLSWAAPTAAGTVEMRWVPIIDIGTYLPRVHPAVRSHLNRHLEARR
ncbi:NUDIX domain-containing protein [Streptomyces sp. NPDC056716]|uniref:NUDIX domain-containing protein n=1 Tax=unclassified Streptomyces TaxID=2593676 RepID=UPI0036B7A4A3